MSETDKALEQFNQAEQKQQKSDEVFRILVTSVKDYAIFMLDPTGVIVSWNEGARRLKQYASHEIIGQHFSVFYSKEERSAGIPERELAKAIRYGRTENEGWRMRKDGTTFWANAIITALVDPSGTLLGFAKVTRDLTERRRHELEMLQLTQKLEQLVEERTEEIKKVNESLRSEIAERIHTEIELKKHATQLARSNADLERFAAAASHDLQEPMRMVANYVGLLAKKYQAQLDDQAHGYIRYAIEGSERMKQLIDAILTYSRVSQQLVRLDSVDLNLLVEEVIGSLQLVIDESGATVTVPPLPTVITDRVLLSQVIQNLLSNAIKFTKGKKPIVQIAVQQGTAEWTFSVKDNGIGVESRYFERIFEMFQRLNNRKDYPGSGIGLAICKRIVDLLGGRMWVESVAGKGSVFLFTIPIENNTTGES